MQDTHYYDNKLEDIKKELENDISNARSISDDQKKVAFQKLKTVLIPKLSQVGLLFFNAMVDNPPVYDPINMLWSTDMLYLCCELSKNKDVDLENLLECLAMQFEDMSTGFCPQGQTIRLLQIAYSFKS